MDRGPIAILPAPPYSECLPVITSEPANAQAHRRRRSSSRAKSPNNSFSSTRTPDSSISSCVLHHNAINSASEAFSSARPWFCIAATPSIAPFFVRRLTRLAASGQLPSARQREATRKSTIVGAKGWCNCQNYLHFPPLPAEYTIMDSCRAEQLIGTSTQVQETRQMRSGYYERLVRSAVTRNLVL
jgi:hypothetical protein